MKKFVVILVAAMGSAVSQATVTVNMWGGIFLKAVGLTPLSFNCTVLLLADANNYGFGDLTQATTSWTADAGDIVLARWGTDDINAAGSSESAIVFDYAGLTAGYDMMLVWYDKAYNAADAGPGELVAFGTFRTDDTISFSDMGWFVPSDGFTVALNFATESLGGDSADSLGIANMTTIPEPATALLALIGGGLAYMVRRRGNMFA